MRTDRYLDPPEFAALHDTGSSHSFFDRIDAGAFHLNVQAGRSSFDVPNTIDQDAGGQDQHQTINSFNVAPGFTKAMSMTWLFAANAYVRRDRSQYTPSGDPFADSPATVSQDRKLTNYGGKVDLSYLSGKNNVKMGAQISATKLDEAFTFGVTDPTLNTACLNQLGSPVVNAITDATRCAAALLVPNPDFLPELVPFDLTRPRGQRFNFAETGTIKSQAAYIQDTITAGPMTLSAGLRVDHYDGLSKKTEAEPRLGIAIAPTGSGTVVRASYGRTLETPYNENLLLSNSNVFGTGGAQATPPGVRDQFEGGIQQALGKWLVVDFGYFNKHTTNAYDFGVLFDTPIVFPISWDHSKLDGFTGRINLVEHGGFSAFTVFGHTNAIFSPPAQGGVLLDAPPGDFRIDHDQKFQQTTNVQYQHAGGIAPWIAFTW